MRIFEFRKYFFDIASTDDSDYMIIFISILKTGPIYNSILQIQSAKRNISNSYVSTPLYREKINFPAGRSNDISFSEGCIHFDKGYISLNIETSVCHIELKYSDLFDETQPCKLLEVLRSGINSIAWYPVRIKSQVTGTITLGQNRSDWDKTNGYIDFVRFSGLPVKNNLKRLFWGRLHSKNIDLTYTIVELTKNKCSSMLLINLENKRIVFDEVNFDIDREKTSDSNSMTYPDRLILSSKNVDFTVKIEVFDHKELIISEFADLGKQYNGFFTYIIRKVSGNPEGIKFLAKANIELESKNDKFSFQEVSLINEYVRFGI